MLLLGAVLALAVVPTKAPAQDVADPTPAAQPTEDNEFSALKWLVAQQRDDGSWNFNDTAGGEAGTLDDPVRATSLALLAFTSTGNTHLEGVYKDQVKAGLNFLLQQVQVEESRGDLAYQGNLLTHAIATRTLCEAYAMTQDAGLKRPAQLAVNQIAHTQNAETGGWGNTAEEPGNMRSFAWHLMALKSAHMAYLDIPAQTVTAAAEYLETLEAESGVAYGYDAPGDDPTWTAAGMHCRALLGSREHELHVKVASELAERGPSTADMEFTFFTTQFTSSLGFESWEAWSPALYETLLSDQALEGEAAGSCYTASEANAAGGRLQSTVFTILAHMSHHNVPDFRPGDIDDFPL